MLDIIILNYGNINLKLEDKFNIFPSEGNKFSLSLQLFNLEHFQVEHIET